MSSTSEILAYRPRNPVKRVVNGKTYNTATATLVAHYETSQDDEKLGRHSDLECEIYRTQGGAFFEVCDEELIDLYAREEDPRGYEPASRTFIQALSRQDLDRLIGGSSGSVDIVLVDDSLHPPEAEAEDDEPATSTMYLRVPPSLKTRCDAAARKSQQSANLWARQALEERLTRGDPPKLNAVDATD